jgi:hypothetical protein
MDGAAYASGQPTQGAAGSGNPFGPVIGVLQGMVEAGAFVVCNEWLERKPLAYMTTRLLHALVAETCCTLGVACSPGNGAEEEALKTAMLGVLKGRGVRFFKSMRHPVRGHKKDVLVRARPAGIPESWYQNKEEALPAVFKDAATLPLTVRVNVMVVLITSCVR